MIRVLTFGLSLTILGGSLFAQEPDSILSCDEFTKILTFINDQHLRFTIAPETDRLALIQQAKEKVSKTLNDLGYAFLAPQFSEKILPIISKSEFRAQESSATLCEALQTSLYRGVFLKAYAKILDPYSDFFLSEELEIRSSVVDGEFVGVGISTDPFETYLQVNHVVEDGPAAKKLFVGDKIFKIDGHPIKGLSDLEVRQRIRGQMGSKVEFSVEREAERLQVEVTRGRVQQRSVSSEMIDNRFLMVRIQRFYRQTPFEVEQAIHKAGQKVRGIILDLRNNPGGLLQAARDVVDLFISSGVVVYLRGRDIDEQVWAMNEGGNLKTPLVVLVNEGTASAAEIVAGALQDYGRAVVVGHRTYGKGSVQNVYETQAILQTKYRGGFKLTTLFYYLPSGRNVDRLEPDVVSASADMSANEKLEHPEMPYRGPAQIQVIRYPGLGNHGFANAKTNLRLSSKETSVPTEEIGKTLLKKMIADRP